MSFYLRIACCVTLMALLSAVPCFAESDMKISGHYYHYSDAETLDVMGDVICFAPDENSAKQLPKSQGIQDIWFCFDDTVGAKKAFGIPLQEDKAVCKYHGSSTVYISDYQPSKQEGDADWNTAHLERVITSEAPKAELCSADISKQKQ